MQKEERGDVTFLVNNSQLPHGLLFIISAACGTNLLEKIRTRPGDHKRYSFWYLSTQQSKHHAEERFWEQLLWLLVETKHLIKDFTPVCESLPSNPRPILPSLTPTRFPPHGAHADWRAETACALYLKSFSFSVCWSQIILDIVWFSSYSLKVLEVHRPIDSSLG